ncbi:MAG: hypothetical protein Q4F17_05715 [Eubacteriales bacterium]|nr:hypothetical protein [Eubacteriales bacterium]
MDKEIKKYLRSVKRRLNLPRDIRTRLLSDLETTIAARMEAGEDWPVIRESLGTPAQVAAEYMEEMKEFAYRKSPWRMVPLAVAVLCGLSLLNDWVMLGLYVSMGFKLYERSVGIIGGADGPTAMFITTRVHDSAKIGIIAAVFVLCLLLYFRLCKCKNKENSQG